MIFRLPLLFLAIFWAQSVAARQPDAETVARTVVLAMLKKYLGLWSTFIGNNSDQQIQSGHLALPKELWINSILSNVNNFWAYLALAQTNKTLNYLVRHDYTDTMAGLVDLDTAREFINEEGRHWVEENFVYLKPVLHENKMKGSKRSLAKLRMSIYNRTRDLGLVLNTFFFTKDPSALPEVPEAKEIVKGLRLVKATDFDHTRTFWRQKEYQYIWLPDDDDGLPLLQRFDPRTVAALCGSSRGGFRSTFLPHLLAQYIIPGFRGEDDVTIESLAPFKALMRARVYFEYFNYLFRALFILESNFSKAATDASTDLFKVSNYLKKIGFKYEHFIACHPGSKNWSETQWNKEEEMWSVFRAAQHWGLDWKRIAKKTRHWCKLSKRITKGDIPRGLHPWEIIDPEDVFKVAFWYEDSEPKRPKYKVKNRSVSLIDKLESAQSRRKRKDRQFFAALEAEQKRAKLMSPDDTGIPRDSGMETNERIQQFSVNRSPYMIWQSLNPFNVPALTDNPQPQPTLLYAGPHHHFFDYQGNPIPWFMIPAPAPQQAAPAPLPVLHLNHAAFLAAPPAMPIAPQNPSLILDEDLIEEDGEEIIETFTALQQHD